jgi:hypothetical protein
VNPRIHGFVFLFAGNWGREYRKQFTDGSQLVVYVLRNGSTQYDRYRADDVHVWSWRVDP